MLAGPSLYVSRADGTDVRLITSGEHPDWSPSGERIAYVIQTQVATQPSQVGVYTMKPDGTDRVKLVSSDGRPGFPHVVTRWSDDLVRRRRHDLYGARVGWPSEGDHGRDSRNRLSGLPTAAGSCSRAAHFLGDGNIYITGAEGGPATVLAEGRRAAWSPDGDQVVFERGGDLYVINADGTGEHALTSGLLSESLPAWSPTGAEIGFLRHGALAGLHAIAPPNGNGSRQLAPAWEAGHGDARAAPSWSLDGRRIAIRDGSGFSW